MKGRRNLGQVLHDFGRIGLEQQEVALEYQRRNGGYFGEALVSLGLISPEELEFGLAAQFNLPYVFPEPESIDLEVARLVEPEWALAHLTLPIARDEGTVRVVVDSPVKPEAVADLERLTGMAVELAIASPARIRDLILFAFSDPGDSASGGPAGVADAGDLLDQAVASGASRMGVSVRGRAVLGWWEASDRIHRSRLLSGWPGALERRISPWKRPGPPPEGSERWPARVTWGGTAIPADVQRIVLPAGEELVLEFSGSPDESPPVPKPPDALVAEARLLARSGAGRFVVTCEPQDLLPEVLRHMPSLVLGSSVRSLHLSDSADVLHLLDAPDDGEEGGEGGSLSKMLRPFRLDAVTVDAESWPESLLRVLGEVAEAVFLGTESVLTRDLAFSKVLEDAGFGWEFHLRREQGGETVQWTLRTLRDGRERWTPSPPPSPPTSAKG